MSIRRPAVAGQFYPGTAAALRRQIEDFVDAKVVKAEAIACVLPHAGYMYSGAVAVDTVSRIELKEKIILLGPNHTGYGAAFSMMAQGSWQTPLGEVKIDSGLAEKMRRGSRYLEIDPGAHESEHSLEVELPILQFFKKDFQIVPVTIAAHDPEALKQAGKDIAAVIKESGLADSTLIVASSDMTHYEADDRAREKDGKAIAAILRLDEDELLNCVRGLGISMCGYAPVTVMLSAAKELGAKSGRLVRYQTSGDVTGDKASVVGYAGIIIA